MPLSWRPVLARVPVATASTGGLVFYVFTDSVSCIATMYVLISDRNN